MDTADDSAIKANEGTIPDELTGLDVEVQAMFERVRARLGLQPNQREMLGRYEIRGKRIGAGGMGSVYRAHDAELERDVAIKVVSTRSLTRVDKLRERLRREAKLLAKLEHPHVVRVYDSGVDEGRVYLAMELVDGATLRERQANAALTEVLRLYVEAGQGLAAIHAQGIVHRDFKPDNVFVGEDGHARVGDFGLAYVVGKAESAHPGEVGDESQGSSRMTQTGEVLGTRAYMAPEQLRGDQPDARSDQYSFCVSLWEALANVRPFDGATREAHLDAQESGVPRGRGRIRWRLRRVLRHGLAARPEDRHTDMDTLVQALQRDLRRQLERRRRLLGQGAFGLLGIVTLAASVIGWRSYQAANPDCPLADAVALQASTADWTSFPPPLIPRFEGHLETLESDAHEACRTDNLARKQQIGTLLHSLELTLEHMPEYESNELDKFVLEFERTLVARPSQPLTPDVNRFILEMIEPCETSWELVTIIQRCDEGLAHVARSDVDRSELLLRRGRARSLNGDYGVALADYKTARRFSMASRDEERQLRANLAAAKTTIMRLEQIDAGAELLELAADLLTALDEPWFSPRRADLLELSATVAKRRGDVDEALVLQREVVWRRALVGIHFELVPAFVNLGSVHEQRGDHAAAERNYRLALRLDAEDPEAQVNLGILLVNQNEKLDEARILLSKVLDGDNPDFHVTAAVILLQLELGDAEPDVIAKRRIDLVRRLRSEQPSTPTIAQKGWEFIVLAHAVEGDVGPDFDAALGQLTEPETEEQQLERARLELNIAYLLPPDRAEKVSQFLDRASTRLERLPASDERNDLAAKILEAQHSP